jgi:hypothetical protein
MPWRASRYARPAAAAGTASGIAGVVSFSSYLMMDLFTYLPLQRNDYTLEYNIYNEMGYH